MEDLRALKEQIKESKTRSKRQGIEIENLSEYLITEDLLVKALINAIISGVSIGPSQIEIHLNIGSLHKIARHAGNPNMVKKRGGAI